MVENTDRVQLAALRVADTSLELLEGAAMVAVMAWVKGLGLPEPLATLAVERARAEVHKAHKEAMAPRVIAPGLDSDLPEV